MELLVKGMPIDMLKQIVWGPISREDIGVSVLPMHTSTFPLFSPQILSLVLLPVTQNIPSDAEVDVISVLPTAVVMPTEL